jgi:hypothetical protein
MGFFNDRNRKPPSGGVDAIAAMYAPPSERPAPEEHDLDAEADPEVAARRARLEERLLQEDIERAMLVALDFAFERTESMPYSRELVRRARTLLWERATWDPEKASLAVYLCGVVRSEETHDARAAATRAAKEAAALDEAEHLGGTRSPSPETLALQAEERAQARTAARAQLDELRHAFEEADDDVNLLWLDYRLQDIDEPAEMAALSGRDVKDFYRAADRRKRHVQRLIAAKRAADAHEKEVKS